MLVFWHEPRKGGEGVSGGKDLPLPRNGALQIIVEDSLHQVLCFLLFLAFLVTYLGPLCSKVLFLG